MAVLVVLVVGLVLFTALLLARLRAIEERLARLEEPRAGAEPYRVAPDRRELHPAAAGEGEDAEVLDALRRGNKIGAIKRYRELTGVGLKEAKEAVEAMANLAAYRDDP